MTNSFKYTPIKRHLEFTSWKKCLPHVLASSPFTANNKVPE